MKPLLLPALLVWGALAQVARAQPSTSHLGNAAGAAPARPVAAPLAAVPHPLAGAWTGPLAVPGKMLSIGLVITETAGHLAAVLETPVARLSHHVMRLTQRHDTLRFDDPLTEARYECQRSPDGAMLIGQWQQPGFREALVLRHEAPLPAAVPQQTAVVRTLHTTKWESGYIENNRRVGLWHYYRYSADGLRLLAQTYDHTAGQLIFACADSDEYETELSPGQWSPRVLTQAPWFIGGHEALAPFAATVRYPTTALAQKVAGKVTVSFVVDSLGHVSDHRVVQGLGSGCDEEALRVARTIPSTWTPGRIGPKAVAVRYYLSFAFRLP